MQHLLRCLVGALVAGALLVSSSAARVALEQPLPGVTYETRVDLTPHGPVRYTIITLPPPTPNPLVTVGPVLAGGTITTPPEPLTQIEQDVSTTMTAVGINGDFFSGRDNHPNGLVVQDGVLEHAPTPARSSIGLDANGSLLVGRIAFAGTWKGSGQRRPLAGINRRPGRNQAVLFTPAWGESAPPVANGAAAVLQPFPAARIDTELTSTVAATQDGSQPTPIPADGAVLVATGTTASKLQAEVSDGSTLTTRLILPPAWANVTAGIGGGPLLVRNHRATFRTGETFDANKLTSRDARAAIGQLADGRLVLVAVDGRQPGYSVGMSTYELAQTLVRLGAATAAAVQPGKPVTAAFDGRLLSHPSPDGGERPVKEGFLLQYAGVYASPLGAPVSGANAPAGEQLDYKLVRPSTVTAAVIAPDGTSHVVDTGSRPPGIYRFSWTTLDSEGTWHWNIKATDDLGRSSSIDRPFTYDLTLSALDVPKTVTAAAGLKAGFTLSRPASVSISVATPTGVVIASDPPVNLQAGTQTLTWTGTTITGAPAPAGSYVAQVTATSAIGTSGLSAPFALRG
jgi:phosphodiester glycosidase/flagellar hook capping protein FlgD